MSRVVPNRELGQHFLVDENILGVIGRLAELGPEDVVLEIGPGLGVLTGYLADRVARVHAVEIDRGLKPSLEERLAGRENVELIFGDALTVDLADLDPPPTKLVANLPYQVATPIVVESIDGLPTVGRWCVMVQREVADRFFAGRRPRPTAPSRFSSSSRPSEPDSTRSPRRSSGPGPTSIRPSSHSSGCRSRENYTRVKKVAAAAFAHRRKTLANSLAQAGLASRDEASPRSRSSSARRTFAPKSSHRPSSSPWTAHCVDVPHDFDPTVVCRRLQASVIPLVDVAVCRGEIGDRPVEDVALAKVGGDRDPITRARVCSRERPAADLPVEGREPGCEVVSTSTDTFQSQSWRT